MISWSYGAEWTPAGVALGLVTFLLVPIFGILTGLAILGLLTLALVGSVVAAPFLLVRSVRRRLG